MRVPSLLSLCLAAGFSQIQAQYLVSELSFGYGTRITPDNTKNIPHFSIQGTPAPPEVLSNKIILTPPAPGNSRAALWGDRDLMHTQWVADVDFRANGPERGGGNLNIWLARDGAYAVGQGSIYTVGRFEGLALVIDTHGGTGGMVRGFLNDGTTDFKAQQVDGLAFGHCNYAYRNLGRPSQLKLRQTDSNFRVEVDGNLCFESDSIALPGGYRFGITAASADNPDSFEVFKLVVMTDNLEANQDSAPPIPGEQEQQQQPMLNRQKDNRPPTRFSRSGLVVEQDVSFEKDMPDQDANAITSSKAQFADLHNRLQSVNHHLSTIFRTIANQDSIGEKRHEELSIQLGELKGLMTKLDKIVDLESRMQNLENEVRRVKGDVSSKVKESEHAIKGLMSDTHATLQDTVKKHAAPGHSRLIFVIIGSQLVLVGGYFFYKKRKGGSHKKYL
ncbi:putative lectin family integral membrane protein [Phaeoacremonium minimum UCRPA7]|uniref:Putative lectin family integral membrane protein n=1 Tax=Phaeoacremonium minimum (strain UCR-PA7) TaxID=1286976 RepID=R8BFL4_PHAM7|nr:putative lectin family integral membrane protein [Phaeoacremonium minimum UCRPA7]EON98093.1 putative lectin family integral membrane protein [Phaeoacremonium minimum UCRPA7]